LVLYLLLAWRKNSMACAISKASALL
jgi:hypothetical protein